MIKWVVELGEHDISFQAGIAIKGAILADLLVRIPRVEHLVVEEIDPRKAVVHAKTACAGNFISQGKM